MAPLAATLVASAAVGVGVAIARANGARRKPARRRRLGLQAGELLAAGLRRMAVEQAELAVEQLRAGRLDSERAVHEARKAIKRMRTIVRLLEGELGAATCAREQAALRRAAEGLSSARDAEVRLATLEGLCRREGAGLAKRKGVVRLRARLAEQRDRAAASTWSPAALNPVIAELEAFASRAAAWPLHQRRGIGTVAGGLERVYRQGRLRGRRAARRKGGRMLTMHQWRKRVKDLRYAAEALRRLDVQETASAAGRGRSARRAARAEARWLERLAKRAEELGEMLGEEHDLAVLEEWVRAEGRQTGLGAGSRRALLKAISRRRAKLRRRALERGAQLYRRGPKMFLKRVARAHRRCAPELS